MDATAPSSRSILDLTYDEARRFLLKHESYCNFDLPSYIDFGRLIDGVDRALDGKALSDLWLRNPRSHDDVNYTILDNKDGKYGWRPLQLIHPALYVSLVHAITEENNWTHIGCRFRQFQSEANLRCLSLPVESSSDDKDRAELVSLWWREVEQRSIELSLDYEYLIETDITDCYGSIYTHSIAWALHTKATAKKERDNKCMIGNVIDRHIQGMCNGQTNGIPQGSVLMDFVAEMVLGLADEELSHHLREKGIADCQILRYRDDYRVFVNSPQIGAEIVKLITETTSRLGLKLSTAKTHESHDVVRASIKSDKLAWMARKQDCNNLQKQLLIIYDHASNFPNAGSLLGALTEYHKRISDAKYLPVSAESLIAIVVAIAYRNPKTYPLCVAILSKLLRFIDRDDDKLEIAKRIRTKFDQIPNTGHMQIWLQRVTYALDQNIEYHEDICELVAGRHNRLWNCDWIGSAALRDAVDATHIVDRSMLDAIAPVIAQQEVQLFRSTSDRGPYG